MINERNKEDVQKKYLELQILANQINQLQQQILSIQNQFIELKNLKTNLEKFGELKLNSETYFPFGLNIFAKARITDTQEFLVGVGSNILLPKTLKETTELLEQQVKEVEQILIELETQLNELNLKGHELQEEITKK